MPNLSDTLAKKLKIALKEHGAVARFSRDVEVNPKTVYRWMDGDLPNLAQVQKIADYFGTTPSLLLDTEEKPTFETLKASLSQANRAFETLKQLREKHPALAQMEALFESDETPEDIEKLSWAFDVITRHPDTLDELVKGVTALTGERFTPSATKRKDSR